MATHEFDLADPPDDYLERARWLQNAAGFILFEDARRYAIDRLAPGLSESARAAAIKGIDDAIYGLMMVIEGVAGALANERYVVDLNLIVRLAARYQSGAESVHNQLNLGDGDGACMAYHAWVAGDFGPHAVATRRSQAKPNS